MLPIVLQLQADALDPAVSASNLLRKAKIVATKLDLSEFLSWINKELNGYEDHADLPLYRKLTGRPMAFNPYRGWQPILSQEAEDMKWFSYASVGQAIGPLEETLKRQKDGSGTFIYPYPPKIKANLVNALEFPTDIHIKLDYGGIWGIVDAVRNIILNWSLELEKSGVLGEGLTFSERDKREAAPVSHQFYAQNIGVVGNVTDYAQVTNVQTAHVQEIDYDKLAQLVREIRKAAPLMPDGKQDALVEQADVLDRELGKGDRDPSRIRRALTTLRSVCEGAAGNVVAEGILALIRGI